MALPDVPTLHGRLYLGAWEQGLSSVADDSALLLSNAVEVMEICYGFKDFSKNSKIIQRHNYFCVRKICCFNS